MNVVRRIWAAVEGVGSVIGTLTTIGTFALLFGGIAWAIRNHEIPAWILAITVAGLLLVAAVSFFVGRRTYRRLPPTAAERARDELNVARTYLRQITDFMAALRLAFVESRSPDEIIPRLRDIRNLVFDAMIQGLNTAPGELIRCVLLHPVEENGVTVLRAREHRGHSHRVGDLTLGMTSVAGRAFLERQPIYIADAATNPLVEPTTGGRSIGTIFCIPCFSFSTTDRGSPTGVLSLASNHDDGFTQSDRTFVTACADILSLAEFYIEVFEDAPPAARPPGAIEAPADAELPPGDTV